MRSARSGNRSVWALAFTSPCQPVHRGWNPDQVDRFGRAADTDASAFPHVGDTVAGHGRRHGAPGDGTGLLHAVCKSAPRRLVHLRRPDPRRHVRRFWQRVDLHRQDMDRRARRSGVPLVVCGPTVSIQQALRGGRSARSPSGQDLADQDLAERGVGLIGRPSTTGCSSRPGGVGGTSMSAWVTPTGCRSRTCRSPGTTQTRSSTRVGPLRSRLAAVDDCIPAFADAATVRTAWHLGAAPVRDMPGLSVTPPSTRLGGGHILASSGDCPTGRGDLSRRLGGAGFGSPRTPR